MEGEGGGVHLGGEPWHMHRLHSPCMLVHFVTGGKPQAN